MTHNKQKLCFENTKMSLDAGVHHLMRPHWVQKAKEKKKDQDADFSSPPSLNTFSSQLVAYQHFVMRPSRYNPIPLASPAYAPRLHCSRWHIRSTLLWLSLGTKRTWLGSAWFQTGREHRSPGWKSCVQQLYTVGALCYLRAVTKHQEAGNENGRTSQG